MTSRLLSPPFSTPFTTADLRRANLSRSTLLTWLRYGKVLEMQPGVFLPAGIEPTDDLRRIYRDRATTLGQHPVSVAGAAAFHGIWTPPQMASQHFTYNRKLPLPDAHLEQHGRLVIPSAAWTSIQLTRGQSLAGALIPLDSALRRGFSIGQLREVAGHLEGWSGTRGLARALAECTGLSGSPLESYSRGVMVEQDVPRPTLQHEFRIHGKRFLADFAWEESNAIGEADGSGKYRQEGEVEREKRRQGGFHSVGIHVLRWGWDDILGRERLWADGIRCALAGSRRVSA